MKENTLTPKEEINILMMHIKELKRHGQHRMAERLKRVLIEKVIRKQKDQLKQMVNLWN